MKPVSFLSLVIILASLASCSSQGKKVVVMASGKLTIDANDQKNIKIAAGTTHSEKEIILTGDKETLNVETPSGNKTFEVNEPGNYLLNLKPDTLIGGVVNYGSGSKTSNLTGEDVDHIIDSTQQLISGKNASDANKTYFVLPYSMKKISANSESRLVGPYNGIPGTVDAGSSGKMPEVYKFFTTKQKRESVEDLIRERKK